MNLPLILHVRVVTGVGGGPDKTVLNSPRHLRRLGYDCECAYLHPPSDPGFSIIENRAKQWEAPLIPVPDRGPLDLRVLRDLIRICRKKRVAVWHAHEYKSNVFGLLVNKFWPMKLVTTVHGWGVHAGRAPLYNRIDKRSLRYYDDVICVSQDLQDECFRHGVSPEKSTLIHNAIDTDEFCRELPTPEARRIIDDNPSGVLLAAMGRLSAEKRFDLLIDAVAWFAQQGQDVRLFIAGEGPERPSLEAKIATLGLGDRVRLLGMVADPRVFLQAADVFVLSSIREGLPNVVLEAMALETPVVATRIAGLPSLLNDGELGVLVEPGDAQSLVAGISRLLANAPLRQHFAAAARTKILESYSFERRMRKVADVYDRLLCRSPVQSAPEIMSV